MAVQIIRRSIVIRGVVLWNALLLALPQGWCCLVPRLPVRPCPEPARSAAEQGKDCCHPKGPGDSGVRKALSPQEPCRQCCCQDGSEVVAPEKARLDLATAAVVPVSSGDSEIDRQGVAPAWGFYSHSPPLRFLHCVWLC